MLMQTDRKIIVVKIGTDALLKKDAQTPYKEPNREVLEHLTRQLAELRLEGHIVVLVSSGAVGMGRAALSEPKSDNETIPQKQKYASVGQAELTHSYWELLKPYGLRPAQMLLERRHFGKDGTALEEATANAIHQLLCDARIIPIFNENDATATEELLFGDNDKLASLIAIHLKADHFIILTSIGGVYSANPEHDSNAKLMSHLTLAQFAEIDVNGKSSGGSGGMKSKREAVQGYAQEVPNGKARIMSPAQCLHKALNSESDNVGTLITADAPELVPKRDSDRALYLPKRQLMLS